MKKKSKQHDAVKSNILHRSDHPTTEMIYFSLREKYPRISLATIYRHLESLTKEGFIHKFTVIGEPDHYDANMIEHIHAYCQKCGEIHDVPIKLSSTFKQQIEKNVKIRINDYQLLASGICHKCEKI